MEKKEIIVLTSGFNTPRIKKRIKKLNKKYKVKLIYLTRTNDNEELRKSTIDLVDKNVKIAIIENKKYLKRGLIYVTVLFNLISYKKKKYYIFGSDFQFFLPFLRGYKYLEIGDLRVSDTRGISKKILILIDYLTLRFIDKLIVTSEYHFSDYYKKYITQNKVIIARNRLEKVDILSKIVRYPNPVKNKIKIGLFGMLRYEIPIDYLLTFIKNNSDSFELIIYGIPVGKYTFDFLDRLAKEHTNIFWKGSYLYPNDLMKIYNEIDLNYVVYDNNSENVRNAIPNKLYESTLFCKPIIACNNTQFGLEVKNKDIGATIPINSYTQYQIEFEKITIEKISKWANNMKNINLDYIFEDEDYLEMI